MKLAEMSAGQLKSLLAMEQTSCREIMTAVLDEIDRREPDVQAYITIRDRNELLAEAEAVDVRRKRGEPVGPLAGLPIGVKDCLCTEGLATTCASHILEHFEPPYDATVVRKIREADGIIVGKTNMDEFAMGSSTENSAYKVTHNPHDLERVPGGTSGGSAAAVAAHECVMALGTDTGGSVRQPGSFCGVVGMKPTYGRVSRYGLVAYGSSLDQVGVLTKNIHDAALLMSVIAGHDPKDSTSLPVDVPDYLAATADGTKCRIGVPHEYFAEGLDAEVRARVENAIESLRQDGYEVVPIHLPHTEYAVPTYYIIACAEASANLARYDGVRYGYRADGCKDVKEMYHLSRTKGFGAEVSRRIMLGTYVLSAGYYDAYYLKAQKVRTLLRRDFEKAFETCDIIMHPEAPTPAFKIGEHTDDPLAMYLGDIYSVIANLVGIPAVSVPCGWTKNGLPIGVQLAAKPLAEPTIFAAAQRLETLLHESGAWRLACCA
ncbi:MAG TPA: Asp-tRNA(Asn)/Glu-tRNA(Gln) amidotransferase subunit GatA [Candidatus Hydrogenedentes bacterium]|nr:Asp-tRNA(Asn)/Glu-tRNA(Gln) amidotransferase subunit GatA [Candidatus Hydrogenedentota bacterium]